MKINQENASIKSFEGLAEEAKDILCFKIEECYTKFMKYPEAETKEECAKALRYRRVNEYRSKISEEIDKLPISDEEKDVAKKYVFELISDIIIWCEESASIDFTYSDKKPIFLPFSKSAAKKLTMTKELDKTGNYIVKYISASSGSVYITDAKGKTINVMGKGLSEADIKYLYKKGYNIEYFSDEKNFGRVRESWLVKANVYSPRLKELIQYLKDYQQQIDCVDNPQDCNQNP